MLSSKCDISAKCASNLLINPSLESSFLPLFGGITITLVSGLYKGMGIVLLPLFQALNMSPLQTQNKGHRPVASANPAGFLILYLRKKKCKNYNVCQSVVERRTANKTSTSKFERVITTTLYIWKTGGWFIFVIKNICQVACTIGQAWLGMWRKSAPKPAWEVPTDPWSRTLWYNHQNMEGIFLFVLELIAVTFSLVWHGGIILKNVSLSLIFKHMINCIHFSFWL